ncbi:hypothetical protein [Chlorobaculum limnaeum]|nr:hypothetical protein [Chlorobaculum limnaeum]
MKQRFFPALVIVLALGGFVGDATFAADASAPPPQKAALPLAPEKMVVKDVPKTGGWSKFDALSSTDRAVFKETMAGLAGVGYEPLVVRKQVVAGTNYEFICNARVVYPGTDWYPAMVLIYKPLKGSAVIKKISRIAAH